MLAAAASLSAQHVFANPIEQTKGAFQDKFRQLEGEEWPTPTDYRNASGAPGYRYWQQKVDYDVKARLDEPKRSVSGTQTVRYKNNSPDSLPYLWLLLDQNDYKHDSIAEMTNTVSGDKISLEEVRRAKRMQEWEGGFTISAVRDAAGKPLKFTVVDSLLRIDLPEAVAGGGGETAFSIDWSFPMVENLVVGGRSGYECFTQPGEDGNCIFEGAQWFPRLAVYSDYEGWHNKAFLGSGEFTLEFGDYKVALTVPSDHVVAATGVLQNPDAALSAAQRQRLEQAKSAAAPVYVVTPEEAAAAERGKAAGEKTWIFAATNVRDFGWASSRKFAWDALGVKQDYAEQPLVMAMSFFPKEARPLWDAYSTKSIAHTIDVYGRFAFPYPYPVAQSVNGPVGGMEYPMITFNGPRPVKDKKTGNLTYTERAKYGLIGVVIHEIGHNWFPMIVNSDERQWTWMDEGLNTFLQFQAERLWDKDYPARRGEPKDIAEYMLSQNQVPLMTQSDSVLQFGANGYGKPATALTILRETVLGRDLFDRAFREYAVRWRFKHPTPYDFFRTLIGSVKQNYETAEFGQYACEPNWIYPICNHYGMLSLASHDALLGTHLVDRHLPAWLHGLETEFTDAAGSTIGLRSQYTGLPVPFPVGEAGYSYFENAFLPERARQQWAIARKELEPLIASDTDGEWLQLTGEGLDAGNYRPGHGGTLSGILVAAREFGDRRIADAALAGLERCCLPAIDDGVHRYRKGSNIANATAVMGALMETGDFAATFTQGAPRTCLEGPKIEATAYPDVLVARAWSDGTGLEAVLYPGQTGGLQTIPISNLRPGARYLVRGAASGELRADGSGNASLAVMLSGRIEFVLDPE